MDFTKFQNNVSAYTETVKDKFLVINGNTVSVSKKVEKNADDITSIISDVIALRQYVDSSFLNDIKDYVNGKIEDVIYNHNEDVSALNSSVNDKFTEIIGNNDEDISAINSSISGIKTDVSVINGKVTDINSSINSLKSDVSALDSSINTWVSAHTTNYNALVTKDSQQDSSISNLKSLVGTTADSSTVQSLFGMIKALREQFDENELVMAQALVDLDARLLALEK